MIIALASDTNSYSSAKDEASTIDCSAVKVLTDLGALYYRLDSG